MSKVILVANRCTNVPYEDNVHYIGVDRGSFFCMENNLPLQYAIGDFDSLEEEQYQRLQNYTKMVELPCEKNETDGEYAIRYAYDLGYDEIDVYGVSGGRQDHFIVIMNLLRYHDINFRIVDEQNCIYTLEAGEHIIKKRSKYLSFFACESLIITSKGVKYPLTDVSITTSDIYLVSNEILEESCSVSITGKILVIESSD